MYYSDDKYTLIPIPQEFEEVYNKYRYALSYDGVNKVFSVDLGKIKEGKLEEMKACRSACWQNFDGLYLSYERDLKLDPTNQVLIDKLQACENLRQCLKDIPETTQKALDSATTLEEVESVCFKGCLTVSTEIADDVAPYFA